VSITHLNISNTSVTHVDPLKQLKNLQELESDSTHIKTIQPLTALENLRVLSINSTSVSDLLPLQKMPKLQKIYCDRSLVKHEAAQSFMAANPSVLVIFDSDDLNFWWKSLSSDWQNVLRKPSGISMNPTKEELAKVQLLDSINLAGRSSIHSLEPIRNLKNLKTLIANKTKIVDISPLKSNSKLQYLDISETEVKDVSALASLTHLKVVKADGSKIENIEWLDAKGLKVLYADGVASVNDLAAQRFLEKNPNCLLIYKTNPLKNWWSLLPVEWKKIFNDFVKRDDRTTREELHALIERETLVFSNAMITDLAPLTEFIRLKELHFSGTAMTTISPVESIQSLKSLHATNSPIQTIESLSTLTDLEDLDISNTPVDDVYELWKLKKLKKLNCAGTQIKRLDALEKLEKLEYFDCSNTNVNKLSALDYLPLTVLKCYNTKVPTRIIENFKASHPNCTVTYYR
jgi:Leucine-rich repeat (LRR) protein